MRYNEQLATCVEFLPNPAAKTDSNIKEKYLALIVEGVENNAAPTQNVTLRTTNIAKGTFTKVDSQSSDTALAWIATVDGNGKILGADAFHYAPDDMGVTYFQYEKHIGARFGTEQQKAAIMMMSRYTGAALQAWNEGNLRKEVKFNPAEFTPERAKQDLCRSYAMFGWQLSGNEQDYLRDTGGLRGYQMRDGTSVQEQRHQNREDQNIPGAGPRR